MFRFTIRDVLWFTVVVALCVAWLRGHLRDAGHLRFAESERNEAIARQEVFETVLKVSEETAAATF